MVLALADQVSIPLGGETKKAESDMARVIEQYPNSQGAKIAEQFLKQLNN